MWTSLQLYLIIHVVTLQLLRSRYMRTAGMKRGVIEQQMLTDSPSRWWKGHEYYELSGKGHCCREVLVLLKWETRKIQSVACLCGSTPLCVFWHSAQICFWILTLKLKLKAGVSNRDESRGCFLLNRSSWHHSFTGVFVKIRFRAFFLPSWSRAGESGVTAHSQTHPRAPRTHLSFIYTSLTFIRNQIWKFSHHLLDLMSSQMYMTSFL